MSKFWGSLHTAKNGGITVGLYNWRIRKSNQLIAKHGLLAQGRKHWEGFSHKNSDNEEYVKHAFYIKGQEGNYMMSLLQQAKLLII